MYQGHTNSAGIKNPWGEEKAIGRGEHDTDHPETAWGWAMQPRNLSSYFKLPRQKAKN